MSGKHPAPTRDAHDTFCTTEGWTLARGAKGQPVTHHRTYELTLPDGRILRTRISKPVNGRTYGRSTWGHILRDQLEVSADEFWACVNDGTLPDRGHEAPQPPAEAVPLGVLMKLRSDVGLSDEEIAGMTKDQAVERLNVFFTTGA
ncbi:cytotoxic translational repressor of toxin-antitoxin stability system [Cellulomonas sp. APG4]|uniref:cytotoxic translational repressor of toxin-antitoxin stability system n=1 Tax=Cellulomonas sp. APG4 TaxID=1538656 RepID=UPI00137B4C36|nr:cytotoxic translational repressor of toxin-antitoxin stability system [Cellulomonas sp. APG4]NCT91976.1 cytotoxic translational repressor of toxin-antitoxin stability system [Cellulomonas sp. APG4]